MTRVQRINVVAITVLMVITAVPAAAVVLGGRMPMISLLNEFGKGRIIISIDMGDE